MVGAALEMDPSSGWWGVPFGVRARARRRERAHTALLLPAFRYILDKSFENVNRCALIRP